MPASHREQGVEFGELADRLDRHDYPATVSELTDAYGDLEVNYADGSASVEAVLAPVTDTLGSAAEARQAVLNGVGREAVGRPGYTDRGAFASVTNDVSF